MAQRRQLGHQRLKIIDLTVVDDADRPALVENRLITGCKVDNREPTVAQADARRKMKPVAVWSAVTQDVGHAPEQASIDPGLPATIKDASYAAHFLIATLRSWPGLDQNLTRP